MAQLRGHHTVRCTFPVLSLLSHGTLPWIPCPAFSYKKDQILDQQAFESLAEHVAMSEPNYSYKVESSRVCRDQDWGEWFLEHSRSPCYDIAATMARNILYAGQTTLEMVAFVETTKFSLGNILDHVIVRIHRHTLFNQDVREDQLYDISLAEWYCIEARSPATNIKWWQVLERQLWRGTYLDYLKVLSVMRAQGLDEPYRPFSHLDVFDAGSCLVARETRRSSAGEAERCPICLESFADFDASTSDNHRTEGEHPVTLLVCGHVFGSDCIARWCSESESCPLCRKGFTEFEFLLESGLDDARIQALLGVVSKKWTSAEAARANDWWFGSQTLSQYSLNRKIWECLQATTLADSPSQNPNANTHITYDTTECYYSNILLDLAGLLMERSFLKGFTFAEQSTAIQVESWRALDGDQTDAASNVMRQITDGGSRVQSTLDMSHRNNLREKVLAFADAAAVLHQSDIVRISSEMAMGLGMAVEWESFMTSEEPLDLVDDDPMPRSSYDC